MEPKLISLKSLNIGFNLNAILYWEISTNKSIDTLQEETHLIVHFNGCDEPLSIKGEESIKQMLETLKGYSFEAFQVWSKDKDESEKINSWFSNV